MSDDKRILGRPSLFLKDGYGKTVVLEDVKTKSEDTKKEVKGSLRLWLENENFDKYRDKLLDLAIVVDVSEEHFLDKHQGRDVDNIERVILNLLEMNKADKTEPYLYKNDRQVVRLLVYKRLKKKIADYETVALHLSFREYDCSEQMILIKKESQDF